MDSGGSSVPVTMVSLDNLNFDVIKDMPWAQDLWEKVQESTKKGFLNWCNIVQKLVGTKAEHVEEWSKQYRETIDETFCELVVDLSDLQAKTIDKIQELLARLEKLCVELHQTNPQKNVEAKLGLFEEQNRLIKQINEYETIINRNKKELEALRDKQQRLCKHLGLEQKFTIQYPPFPTPAQLETIQKYIEELESEKFEREEKYCLLKHDITKLVEEIKYKPTSDFEQKVLSSDNFLVTKENLKKLEFFLISLKEIKKATEEEISQLRGRTEDLWKMLDVDLMDRQEFRSHYTGNSIVTLEALRLEVKRCEEVRKANIKNFVDKLRVQLQDTWIKCHCTDSTRRAFKYFNSDCYTEDLLDLHELELQKWRSYYEDNSRLLGLLEKHQELWEKVIMFEENATGPNRYQNRGGKLLQEEKERNKLSKMIPKIEEEIRTLSEEYRNINNGVSFTSFGRTPEEYIDNIHAERENARKLKLSARKMQRDNTKGYTPAKSVINLFPSTSTAVTPTTLSSTKRKILATPNTENTKRLRVNTPKNPIKTYTPATDIPRIKVTHATLTLPRQKRRSRSSLERRKRLGGIRKKSGNLGINVVPEHDVTKNTTYSDFQTELSSREQGRSTILPDQHLAPAPAATRKRQSPLRKTPVSAQSTPVAKGTSRTPLRTPSSRTPNRTAQGSNLTKMSACKSNLKLLF